MLDIFNMVVSEFYHKDNVYYATKARNVLATACSFVERNLSECNFGAYCRELKNNGTKNEKIWAEVKEKFPYISTRLSDDELYDLIINVYKPIRNCNMHSRIYYDKDKLKKIQFEFAKLPKYKFIKLKDKELTNENNELTLYGCCAVIGLFLKGYQMKKFAMDLSTYYYKNKDDKREYLLDMPNEYRDKKKWDQIEKTQKSQCFVKSDGKEKDLILFQEKYILSIVADFFLYFEDYIIKNGMVKQIPNSDYNVFKKLINQIDIKDGLKRKIVFVRNMWAHGNYCYYIDSDDKNKNLMLQFIQMLNGLKETQFAQMVENASKRILKEILEKKYKQAIKGALESQKYYNDFDLLNKCIENINNIPIRHASVPIEVEKELAKLVGNKTVKISLDKVDDTKTEYEFSSIKIIIHKCKDGFEVNGFKTQFTEITEYIVNEVQPLKITLNGKLCLRRKREIYKTPFMTQSEWWYQYE